MSIVTYNSAWWCGGVGRGGEVAIVFICVKFRILVNFRRPLATCAKRKMKIFANVFAMKHRPIVRKLPDFDNRFNHQTISEFWNSSTSLFSHFSSNLAKSSCGWYSKYGKTKKMKIIILIIIYYLKTPVWGGGGEKSTQIWACHL
jgi:hypothetical protein